MNFDKKIITRIPMDKIWDRNGYLAHKLKSYLTPKEVVSKISSRDLICVIAAIGALPEFRKINSDDIYWIETIKSHLADPEGFHLDDFTGGYAFIASEWIAESDTIILFELHH